MTTYNWITLLIIILTIAGIAVGRYPYLRMNRATISLVGAIALVLIGSVSLQQAYSLIDFDTILLLFAMMIINVNLQISGFFQLITSSVSGFAKTPKQLLAIIILSSGILSALFLNDTICIMLTPLILEAARLLKRNPIPYLIGLAASANIGSVATIVGNPQNMLIGLSSKISFTDFFAAQFPVALVGMFIAWCILIFVYKKEFAGKFQKKIPAAEINN